jgi:hypothetical protein
VKERIIELAGANVPPGIIASTVGCDPSYVTQVLSEEAAQDRVMELRGERAVELLERDSNIDEIQDLALARIKNLVPMQSDVMKLTRVFQVMNAARKASDHGINPSSQGQGATVVLELPADANVHFKLTSDRQVIEVEGRSMVPMPSQQVQKQLRTLQATRLLESTQPQEAIPLISHRTKSIVDQL